MKWIITRKYFGTTECEDARDAAEYIMENCDEECYDDFLDECYEEVEICGYKYAPSVALYHVDPTAYRCGRSDWEDFEAGEIAYELERMDDGEELSFYGFDVECIEDEEEDEDNDE